MATTRGAVRRPTLYLTVGLPGAGKTTAARRIAERENILRLTPDDWMVPLFGTSDSVRRDILEGRMLDVARQVLASGAGVVVDFGCWSPEERWAVRALTEASGGRFEMVPCELDEAERRRRATRRWLEAPETTFEMTDADHDAWLAAYQAPTAAELTATQLPPCPAGHAGWGAWACARWPTLPLVECA